MSDSEKNNNNNNARQVHYFFGVSKRLFHLKVDVAATIGRAPSISLLPSFFPPPAAAFYCGAHDKTMSGSRGLWARPRLIVVRHLRQVQVDLTLEHCRVSLLRDAVQTAAGAQRPLHRRPQPAELVAGKTVFATLSQQQRHPQQQLQGAARRHPTVQEILQGI